MRRGFPIRISADQRSLASPRGFSQRATSFIASWRQGIHRMPFSHSISTPLPAHRAKTRPHATTSLGRQRPHHPPGAVKACPGRCASLAHTTTHHLHHVKEHARPARRPAPSRGSQTTPHGRVSEVSPPQRAAHQAFSTAPLRQPGTAEFLSRLRHERKWRRSDSNRRPPACKAGALPLSYAPAGEDRQQLHPIRSTAPLARHHTILGGTRFLRSRNLVGQGGLEPPTPRLSSVCSNQLSYWPRITGSPNPGKDARSAPAMAFATTRHAGKAGHLQTIGISVIERPTSANPIRGQPRQTRARR